MSLIDPTRRRSSRQTIAASLGDGQSIYLRHATRGDRIEWCTLRTESAEFLEPWEPKPPADRPDTAARRFASLLETQNLSHTQRHLICRKHDDAIVGMVNLSQIARGPFQNAVIGYWCGERFARNGYTSEAVLACVHRAFTELGLHRVECNVRPENVASIALARRVGFREEGFSPKYLQIAGVWADHIRFALTREDRIA